MSKIIRPWDVEQSWLLPSPVHDFVPPGHLAHFVRDTVREVLDLSAIFDVYTSLQGQPPYHPGMLVALLLYGYSRGIYARCRSARYWPPIFQPPMILLQSRLKMLSLLALPAVGGLAPLPIICLTCGSLVKI